jgi:hypothetical protein
MRDVSDLLGKEVEVICHGMSYKGILVEVSDAEVHLKTTMQWMSLPASSVGDIRRAEAPSTATADRINVEPRQGDEM